MSMSKHASSADLYRAKLIEAGVRNLKTFGYPDVTKENILTDPIYRPFFKSMLGDSENMGRGMDKYIMALLEEIKQHDAASHASISKENKDVG